jgi:hypothetical protein
MFVDGGVGLSFVAKGPFSGRPALAVLVPEAAVSPPEYNVGVRLPLDDVQQLITRQPWRDGITAAVIDAQQRVMGRSRDPEKWLGQTASHTGLRALAQKGGSGFIRTTTLDGVASLTYLSPPGPHGWATVVALPEAALQAAAWDLALRAVAVSALLLGLGLLLALIAARRISQPVRALERAAGELLAQRVPQPLHTGLAEIDRVGAVLHDAGARPGVMTGIELVEWCRANRPELPALVATGYSTRAPQGVWKMLRKPYTIEDLLDALDACAARETEEA